MKSKTITIAFLLTLFFSLSAVIVFLLLPFIADKYLATALAKKLPFDQSVVSISRITPWSTRGTLLFGSEDQTALSIARFEADYSPSSLLQGRIYQVLLDAAVIHLQIEKNKPSLRGLPNRPAPSEQKTVISLPVLPFTIDRIDIVNAQVTIHRPNDISRSINMDGELIPTFIGTADGGHELRAGKLAFTTRGNLQLKGELAIKPQAENHQLMVRAELANLDEVLSSLTALKSWHIFGGLVIEANVLMEGLQNIGKYSITAETTNFNIQGNGIEAGLAAQEKRATLDLKGDLQQVKYSLKGLGIKRPEPVSLEADGFFDLDRRKLEGRLHLLSGRMGTSLFGVYQGTVGARTALSYTITGEGFSFKDGMGIDSYSANGEIEYEGGSFSGKVQAAVNTVNLPEQEISLRGISVDIPYNFPSPTPESILPENLIVEQIRYRDEHIATIKGRLSLTPERINLNIRTTTPLHERFSLDCNSTLQFQKGVNIQCILPQIEFDASHLPSVVVLPDGLQFSGKIAAEASYSTSSGVPKGEATVIPSEIQINFNDYAFSGINGKLKFPRLPLIQSSPSQLFTIETIDLGKLRMSDAKIFMRIDDSETLFVEEARLRWSGGRVEAGALRLYKDMERLETRLYCDRLSYTELLDQFGVGDAEGGGSLNGRLPIVISREGVEFDDGFLFSTPGDSGIVRFNNTQRLRQGMAGMSNTIYLDYSMDALENFAYNWTKLTFNTEGEELLLTLQLDGKPAEPLPYGYRSGQIVKTAEGQGIQHPLRLDVNFRLPMRDLLHYGKSIQSLMENM